MRLTPGRRPFGRFLPHAARIGGLAAALVHVAFGTPAATYLPGLRLADAYATRELSVRDLLSHRAGLARGELAWYGSGFDRDEIVRRVRFLQPSWSFRSEYGYQNIMYIAAGKVDEGQLDLAGAVTFERRPDAAPAAANR